MHSVIKKVKPEWGIAENSEMDHMALLMGLLRSGHVYETKDPIKISVAEGFKLVDMEIEIKMIIEPED